MSFRFVNLMCTLTFALACGSNVVDAGKLPDETGNASEFVDAGSQVVPDTSSPDAGTPGGSGCAIPDLGRYRLVFDSDGGKLERRIYSMRADGTELEALTPPGELAREPALSPDGKSLAYVTPEGIRLLSMVTGQSELLVPDGEKPTWSADGLYLFHLICPRQQSCASSMTNLADRSTADNSFITYDMDLSADGSIGVYPTGRQPESYGIVVVYTDGRYGWEAIAGSPVPVLQPTISPDGSWLAAAMQCPNEQWPSLWISPVAVTTAACEGHRVTPAGGVNVSNPKWGPGNLIAYERAAPPRDIAIVSADTGEECVIPGPGDDRNPSWAPLADFAPPQ
jgi:Tol biopolymer transport system component